MMNDPSQQQKPSRIPLRRAVYVHISDLTSAYNIDHKKLEEELARVKVESDPSYKSTETPPDEASVASISHKRLQPPRAGFNLCVLVGKVNIVVDKLRVDRSRVRLAEVLVGDETGTVSLRARDDQIDLLQEISERCGAVVLRNCTLELFQGRHIRLAVTKWGKMSAFPDDVPSTPPPPSKMNNERNFSLIDLSLVASEMVENQLNSEASYQATNYDNPSRPGGNRNPLPPSQAAHQQRRTPRRQARSKANKPQTVPFPEIPINDQVRYQNSMQGYGYSEAMEMQQFYGALPLSQHHRSLLQHQQYEMQQRQMQHLQAYHDHHHQQQQHSDQHRSPMLPPMQTAQVLVPSSSFDSGQPPEFPSLPSLVPMPDNRHSTESSSNTATMQAAPDTMPWRGKVPDAAMEDTTGNSPGSMNPQATAFAPTYVKTQGGQIIHSQQYPGYNPYEQRGRAYAQQALPTMYSQNIVYVPVPEAVSSVIVPDHRHQQVTEQASDKKAGKGTEGAKQNY